MKTFLAFICLLLCASCGVTHDMNSTGENEQLQGTFTSKKGVMVPMSCHGYNIGYLQTAEGEKNIVCFDRLRNSAELDIPQDKTIRINGKFEDHLNAPNENSSCTPQTLRIFYAESWKIVSD